MKIYDLPVMGYDRAKSFYGKAKVIEKDNGEKVLQSYNTEVCKITSGGEFVRLWSGYSVTTMRHVNSFLNFFNLSGGGKAYHKLKIQYDRNGGFVRLHGYKVPLNECIRMGV